MIRLKGTQSGIKVLVDGAAEHDALLQQLRQTLLQSADFLRDAELTFEVSGRQVDRELAAGILRVLAEFPALRLKGIVPSAERTVRSLGSRGSVRLIRGTVRSGQEIRHQGDIVVLGDVNAGASLTATSDIIVIGALRGFAHAGSHGDQTRQIYASLFEPIQVRIGNVIAVSPQHAKGSHPEVARVDDGSIVVEAWQPRDNRRSMPSRRAKGHDAAAL